MQKKQVKVSLEAKAAALELQEQVKEPIELCINSDEELGVQAKDQVKQLQLHNFIQNKEQMFDKVKQLCDESVTLIEKNLFQESNYFLEQAEEIIEFAANRGKLIDRNLIIAVLYNRACSYQGLWKLDKCNKYIDAVIYNLESSLKNDFWPAYSNFENEEVFEKIAYKIKRQTFLVRCYLQQCAILSQLVLHKQAIETAKKAISVLEEIFNQLVLVCSDKMASAQSTASSVIKSYKQQDTSNMSKSDNKLNTSQKKIVIANTNGVVKGNKININNKNKVFDSSDEQEKEDSNCQSTNPGLDNAIFGAKKSIAKEEVVFSKIIQDQAHHFLKTFESKVIFDTNIGEECSNQLKKARQSIYFWKNNPENNERNMRQELNVPTKNTDDDNRNIVGVQKSQEWIEQFNIGSIMHMTCIDYDEFTQFEDILFELSKKQLIEKMLFLSICFFTIATEIRFIELDKQKNLINSKTQAYDLSKEESYKQSEIYHLKSIEIVCQAVTCYSPYITHLINSYHKHYNSSLDIIEEEVSILSNRSHNSRNSQSEYLQISFKDTNLSKYTAQSKNTAALLESSELQEQPLTISKNYNDQTIKEINPSKPYVAQKYIHHKPTDNAQNKGSSSFNSFTNNSRSPQKDTKGGRKRSPQDTQAAATSTVSTSQSDQIHIKEQQENVFKRPKSHHTGSTQENDTSPLLTKVKINKTQISHTKKQALAIDLETINSTFGNNNTAQNHQNSTVKNIQTKDSSIASLLKKPYPTSIEDQKKIPKQKENLSQNNMNQLSILRNYSSSNGSPRLNAGTNPIKNIFSGKNSHQSSQSNQSTQQPYLIQNQQQQQQQQNTVLSQTQNLPSSQQFQQQLQLQQYSLSAQQQQLLKALQNNKISQPTLNNNNNINSINNNMQNNQNIQNGQQQQTILKNQSNNATQKGVRVFSDTEFRIINEVKSPEEKGSQSHRNIAVPVNQQNKQTANNYINSIENNQLKVNNSLLKASNSTRSIQINNQSQSKLQSSYLKQISSQNITAYKNLKNEINISPKQPHHFLQQFDFISSKNPLLSQQNSKEIIVNNGSSSARNTQTNFNLKAIPKLDFNQIQNNPVLKTEENIRFFSARDHSAKKVNNYVNKQN